ncbi:sensor histidine kinase [Pseudohongiella sp. SYSU M77423]|uniref:sensor histidine kinase n=1 Tax=Pseudohongiella sp. SYSU M77423 TaxID=3042312 RepID=UPI00248022B4|nr:sensor histidine kinase [Pseudohongiella sp. SYSU M77423]
MHQNQPITKRPCRQPAVWLAGFVLSLCFVCAGVQAQTTVRSDTERLLLGQQALTSHLSEEFLDRWLQAPADTFAELLSQFPSDIALQSIADSNVAAQDWSFNSSDKLLLDAPSRLNWIVVDLIYRGTQAEQFMLDMTGMDGVGWVYVNHIGETISHWDDFSAPQGGRPVFDTKAVMPLNLVPNHPYRLHIVAMTVTEAKYATFTLWDDDGFRAVRLQQTLLDGAYFGLVIALILYNLLLYIALRRNMHLYFCLFIFASAGMIYIGSGLSLIVGLQNPFPLSLPLAYLFQGLIGITAAIFSMSLLNISDRHSRLYRMWIAVLAINICVTPLIMYLARDGGYSTDGIGITFSILTGVWLISQLVYIYTLSTHWRQSLLVRFWFTAVTIHTWAMAAWPMLMNSSLDLRIAPYHLAQLATLLDTIVLSALIAYTMRSEQHSRIKAQQKAVESLRLSHDLEHAKSNFVSAVGHDLRGPIQAISHYTEAFRLKQPNHHDRDLDAIDQNVKNVSELIDNMIRLSRVERQASNPVLEAVRLEQLLMELKSEFSPRAASKKLSLIMENTAAVVFTDRISLSQILRNLLDNALKYSERGEIRVSARQRGSKVILSVRDSGVGIPEDRLPHIFTAFYQGQSGKGIGLGLSIVKRLANLLDISIDVASTVGYGTRFTLTLESATSDQHQSELAAHKKENLPHKQLITSLEGISVLVIDYRGALAPLHQYLTSWGASVTHISDNNDLSTINGATKGASICVIDSVAYLSGQAWMNVLENTSVIVVTAADETLPASRLRSASHLVIDAKISPMQFRSLIHRKLHMRASA